MSDKIDIKDIHETFWRCRDFEIGHLWQRSIFLTAFLVLAFTAYGTVVSKLIDTLSKTDSSFLILNIISYVLALLGVVLSILWIKMGKGSKAWYEVYESAIGAIEKDKEYTTKEARQIGGFGYNSLPGYRDVELDNSLFSVKAGEYSVSKINIGIGQVFLVLWLLIAICHTIIIGINLHNTYSASYYDIIAVCSSVIFILIISVWVGHKNRYKSGAIKWFETRQPDA